MENVTPDSSHSFQGTPFGDWLQGAVGGDLADLSKTQCVGLGHDSTIPRQEQAGEDEKNTLNCIYFIPQLGFDASNGDKNYLERMISLFVKMSQDIVHNNYSIIYGSSKYSLFSQAKLMRRLYKALPRCYKKNLSRIYFLHPTSRFRTCVKILKMFLEDKVVAKITFINTISQLQSLLSPFDVQLPSALIQMEDEIQQQNLPAMASLDDLYEEHLGAPPFISKCISFLRKRAMMREGLFRVPGDQTILNLAPPRFRDKECASIMFDDDENDLEAHLLCDEEQKTEDISEHLFRQSAAVVIRDVDVVAQLFKSYLRELPEAVITEVAYNEILMKIRSHSEERRNMATSAPSEYDAESALGEVVEHILEATLPHSHWQTLQLILEFLADIAAHSPVNKMTPDNISVVFAPTLIHIDMSAPEIALESVPICQKIVRLLLMRHMEKKVAERLSPKLSLTRTSSGAQFSS